jgi:hypothetical protein
MFGRNGRAGQLPLEPVQNARSPQSSSFASQTTDESSNLSVQDWLEPSQTSATSHTPFLARHGACAGFVRNPAGQVVDEPEHCCCRAHVGSGGTGPHGVPLLSRNDAGQLASDPEHTACWAHTSLDCGEGPHGVFAGRNCVAGQSFALARPVQKDWIWHAPAVPPHGVVPGRTASVDGQVKPLHRSAMSHSTVAGRHTSPSLVFSGQSYEVPEQKSSRSHRPFRAARHS